MSLKAVLPVGLAQDTLILGFWRFEASVEVGSLISELAPACTVLVDFIFMLKLIFPLKIVLFADLNL